MFANLLITSVLFSLTEHYLQILLYKFGFSLVLNEFIYKSKYYLLKTQIIKRTFYTEPSLSGLAVWYDFFRSRRSAPPGYNRPMFFYIMLDALLIFFF